MPIVTTCQPFTIIEDARPREVKLNLKISHSPPHTQFLNVYYTVNGVQGGFQNYTIISPGAVGYGSITPLVVEGDIISICVEADLTANIGDSGAITVSGILTHCYEDGLTSTDRINFSCPWEAIGTPINGRITQEYIEIVERHEGVGYISQDYIELVEDFGNDGSANISQQYIEIIEVE